jgi:arabinogalactan endo-1,4-beta-galactosidase
VVNRFKEEGVLPVIIQVGNETNAGFLWDMGRVGGAYNSNWGSYTMLLKSAVKAIRDAEEENEIRVMLHIAGITSATWFFDNITQYLVDYDVIGLSFYSIWHGTNYTAWEDKFLEVANRYSKEIMVVETGYPWTLGWNDWTNNIYGLEEQLFPDLPATPEGQKQFLQRLDSTILSLGMKGIGFCYWAPDLVAFKGPQAQDGSVWENVAVFDFDNQALPVIEVFSGKAQ